MTTMSSCYRQAFSRAQSAFMAETKAEMHFDSQPTPETLRALLLARFSRARAMLGVKVAAVEIVLGLA